MSEPTEAADRPAIQVGDLVSATFRVALAHVNPAGATILRLEPVDAAPGPTHWEQVVWLDARQVSRAGAG